MLKNKPKVGLCICTYDRKDSLEKCITTLFQTTKHIKNSYYLVVDDCSSDSTKEFLETFNKSNPKLNYNIKQKNRGYVDSFNMSLDMATKEDCDVIFVINDDMTFKKTGWVELYLEAIEKSGIQHFNFMDGRNVVGRRDIDNITITYHPWVRGCIEIITKDMYESIGGYNPKFHGTGCMDTEYSDRAILNGFTDDSLKNLIENKNISYGNFIMGFCADVKKSRDYIFDPHPNMGIISTDSNFSSSREAAIATLRHFRISNGFYNHKKKKRMITLCYHQISGGNAKVDKIAGFTEQNNFRNHIRFMKLLGYQFIEPKQLLNPENIPDNSVLITFDDGYKNNYINALPILKEENVKALLFLTTGYVASNKIKGYELLTYMIKEKKISDVIETYSKIAANNNIPDFTENLTEAAFRMHFRSDLTLNQQRYVAETLANKFNFKVDQSFLNELYLSWSEIDKMKDNFEFGAHSVNHPLLSHLDDKQACFEIEQSKNILEQKLGQIDWFAYPYGYPNSFSHREIGYLQKLGFKGAFTTLPMHTSIPIINQYAIGRYSIANESTKDLITYMCLNV